MLTSNLLLHLWKSFFRNALWRRNLFSRILFGILIVYFIVLAIFVGLHIDTILTKIEGNPFDTFNSFILYYFIGDLLIRCFLQLSQSLQIIPYLRFKIRRSTIINHLLISSLWNMFNFIPIFIILPFAIKIIGPNIGIGCALTYLLGFFLIVILNNYLAALINYLSKLNAVFLAVPFILATTIIGLQKVGFPIKHLSISMGNLMLQGNPIILTLIITCLACIYVANYKILLRNFYIDEFTSKNFRQDSKSFTLLDIFNKYGNIGTYLTIELKLLIRNKRPRQMLLMLPILIVYLLFITSKNSNSPFMNLFLLAFFCGFGGAIYGQFMFSWESSYFDGILTRKTNLIQYMKSKFSLLIMLSAIGFIPVSIILLIKGKTDILLILSFLAFSVGVNNFIIMLLATFNDGRIDLSQSQFFNYQGMKGNQFILTLVIMTLSIGFYYLFAYIINDLGGKILVLSIGLLFIITHMWWLKNIIIPRFMARKYKNLEGYRKLTT